MYIFSPLSPLKHRLVLALRSQRLTDALPEFLFSLLLVTTRGHRCTIIGTISVGELENPSRQRSDFTLSTLTGVVRGDTRLRVRPWRARRRACGRSREVADVWDEKCGGADVMRKLWI